MQLLLHEDMKHQKSQIGCVTKKTKNK